MLRYWQVNLIEIQVYHPHWYDIVCGGEDLTWIELALEVGSALVLYVRHVPQRGEDE